MNAESDEDEIENNVRRVNSWISLPRVLVKVYTRYDFM